VEREERGVEHVAEFVCQLPGSLDLFGRARFGGEARVLRHGFCDRRVEATIQRVEFFGRDRKELFDGDLGDGLADITVVVDDLRDVEPQCSQLASMLRR
jgi:hypothetical protein